MGGMTKRKATPWIPLDGGVDEYHDSFRMDDNRLQSAVNVHIQDGKLMRRPAKRLFNSAFASGFNGVHEYIDSDGSARLLVASGGTVYEVDSVNKTARDTVTDELLRFSTFRNVCYYNGANTQRKIIKTTASRIGIVAPSSAPTLGTTGTGLTGSYGYKYTYAIEDSGVLKWESNPSPGASVTLTNQSGTVQCSASADSRVTHRYIYRTTAGGAIYAYVGKIADNLAGSTFTDNVGDALLGAMLETNHGSPVSGTICVGCNERLFWIVAEKLAHSEQAHTDSYLEYQQPVDYFHYLTKGGLGTGIKPLYNANTGREDLIVFQGRTMHVLPSGDALQPLVTISQSIGCVQHDTIAEYRGGLVFLSSDYRVQYYTGGRILDISSRNWPVSLGAGLDLSNCRGSVIFGHYYALTMRNDATKIYKNCVWVCDLNTVKLSEDDPNFAVATWFRWDIEAEYLIERADGTVLAFDNLNNQIWSLIFTSQQDEDLAGGTYTPIAGDAKTKRFNFGLFSRFRANMLRIKGTQSQAITVNLGYGDEYSSEASSVSAVKGGYQFIMGTNVMGDRTSTIASQVEASLPVQVAGNWIEFSFSKSLVDEVFYISGIQFSRTVFERV